MSGNTEIIDSVVDPAANLQVKALQSDLSDLDAQFIVGAKHINDYNNALLNSKNFTQFNTNVEKVNTASQKQEQLLNKTATSAAALQIKLNQLEQSNIRLANAQEKANQNAQKALSPYQQLSKQLDQLRASAKDAAVTFGVNSQQFKDAAKPAQDLDAKLKGIDQTLGQSQRNVGNYSGAIQGLIAQYLPFGQQISKTTGLLEESGSVTKETTGAIGALGAEFVGFTTAGFAIAISAAIYYLSQFKSTANATSTIFAGIKNQFASFGQGIVTFFTDPSFSNLGKAIPSLTPGANFVPDFTSGAASQQSVISLKNQQEIANTNNAQLQAESEKNRALSADRTKDIADRQQYLKAAQANEQAILDNQKKIADLTINTAIGVGNKLGTLNADQIKKLKEGDLAFAQNLANNGQQFTEEGYDLYKQGIDQRIALQQNAANQIVKLQSDADNMQLRADRTLAEAQDKLDKARVQSAIDTAKLTLDSDTSGYNQKIKANETFVNKSIELLKVQERDELGNAGLGGRGGNDSRTQKVQRAAIEQETQNAINKVVAEGAANKRKIIKDNNDLYTKDALEAQNAAIGREKAFEDEITNGLNKQLSDIDDNREQIQLALSKQYKDGLLSLKTYNDDVQKENDKAESLSLSKKIEAQRKIVAAQAVGLLNGSTSPQELQGSANKLAGLNKQQTDATIKGNENDAKSNDDKLKDLEGKIEKVSSLVNGAFSDVQDFVNNAAEAQIASLEKQAQLIDQNATAQKKAVQDSIASSATKAREEAIIDAKALQDKNKIATEEGKIKHKQAVYDKAAKVAQIIESTAVAVVEALTAGPFSGEALAIIVGAIGAAELAAVIAQPIPTYAKGGTTKRGLSIWGEAGIEMAIEPGGKKHLSDGATLSNFPVGTQIISNKDLAKHIRPGSYYVGGEQTGWNEVLRELKRNRPVNQKRPVVVVQLQNNDIVRRMKR